MISSLSNLPLKPTLHPSMTRLGFNHLEEILKDMCLSENIFFKILDHCQELYKKNDFFMQKKVTASLEDRNYCLKKINNKYFIFIFGVKIAKNIYFLEGNYKSVKPDALRIAYNPLDNSFLVEKIITFNYKISMEKISKEGKRTYQHYYNIEISKKILDEREKIVKHYSDNSLKLVFFNPWKGNPLDEKLEKMSVEERLSLKNPLLNCLKEMVHAEEKQPNLVYHDIKIENMLICNNNKIITSIDNQSLAFTFYHSPDFYMKWRSEKLNEEILKKNSLYCFLFSFVFTVYCYHEYENYVNRCSSWALRKIKIKEELFGIFKRVNEDIRNLFETYAGPKMALIWDRVSLNHDILSYKELYNLITSWGEGI